MTLCIAPLVVTAELLAAQLMFLFRERRRHRFLLRAVSALAITTLFLFLWSGLLEHVAADIMFYFLLFVFTVCIHTFLFDISWQNALYWSTAGIVVQHTSYSIMILLGLFRSELFYSIPLTVFVNAAMLALSYSFAARIRKGHGYIQDEFRSLLPLSLVIIMTTIFLNSFRSNFASGEDHVLNIVVSVYSLLCCALSFGLLMRLFERSWFQRELETVRQLWYADRQQYELSNQNMEMLSIYCHDLKHMLNIMDGTGDSRQYRQQLEETLELFDAGIETNNRALDVILTEKSLCCHKKGITMTCMADGSCLDFMETAELYTIFGNLLSNAIEAVCQIDRPEKRIVSITVNRRNDLVYIHVENYFNQILSFDGDLPRTTKQKQDYALHGYGLKSVRILVEKYHGNLTVETSGEIFYANIMIPAPPANAARQM